MGRAVGRAVGRAAGGAARGAVHGAAGGAASGAVELKKFSLLLDLYSSYIYYPIDNVKY